MTQQGQLPYMVYGVPIEWCITKVALSTIFP